MTYNVKLLSEARSDIKESIDWYNDQKAGLGKLFYQAVKARINYIQKNPFHYQISYRNIHSAPVSKFPFQIHYITLEPKTTIIVLAVTHTSRNPQLWKGRK